MKKSLFFYAAATALMLTACSSEDDILQTGQTKQVTPQEVGFDVYTQAATQTRAGQQGILTTSRIQRAEKFGGGFGVYAFLTEDVDGTGADVKYTSTDATKKANIPNFMVNEKLLWNEESQGWYYNPLKYWPNETDNDSQSKEAIMNGTNKHTDRLTFFAYAPYVTETAANGTGTGITRVTDKNGTLNGAYTSDPSVEYKAVLDNPNNGVDLLWGVAPAGGLNYTAVNGNEFTSPEGFPLKDMIKPNVSTNMKFLFQHALARLNVKAVAAIDQIGAGGTLDPNTRITIEKITITGPFGLTGRLNLNNSVKDVANWIRINDINIKDAANSAAFTAANQTITITANETTPAYNGIAEHLRYVGTHSAPVAQTGRVGVTTVLQNVLEPAVYSEETPWVTYKTYADGQSFDYSETTPYYDNEECSTPSEAKVVLPTGKSVFTINSKGVLTELASTPTGITYPTVNIWYVGKLTKFADGDAATAANAAGKQAYTYDSEAKTYTPIPVGTATAANYEITAALEKATIKYTNNTGNNKSYYKRDANYFMIVPTNNIPNVCTNISTYEEALRTLTVSIEYYITTEDTSLKGGIAQTKNVVKKDVVFPSIANGKSYNLNLILGLTSVKMEAEVDDWKVVNVNGDLPQNTAE